MGSLAYKGGVCQKQQYLEGWMIEAHTLDLVAALDRAGGARALAAARDDGRAGDGGGGEREDEGEAGAHRVVAIEESVQRRTKERE